MRNLPDPFFLRYWACCLEKDLDSLYRFLAYEAYQLTEAVLLNVHNHWEETASENLLLLRAIVGETVFTEKVCEYLSQIFQKQHTDGDVISLLSLDDRQLSERITLIAEQNPYWDPGLVSVVRLALSQAQTVRSMWEFRT